MIAMNRFYLACILLSCLSINKLWAQFTEMNFSFENVNNSSVAWGDYDQDGDLDIFLMGWNGKNRVSKIYRNQNGQFEDIQAPLPGLNSVLPHNQAWADYDRDGDLDLLMTGQNGAERVTMLFRNEGGRLVELRLGLPGLFAASVDWGDYDQDGDLDLLITGRDRESRRLTQILVNENGRFSALQAGLEGIANGTCNWVDYDKDGDLDIFLSGRDNQASRHTVGRLYRNEDGKFVSVSNSFAELSRSASIWGDFDGDADMDLLVSGLDNQRKKALKLYQNNLGDFAEVTTTLPALSRSAMAWGDYDQDGDLDLLLSGVDHQNRRICNVYQNEGRGQFIDLKAGLKAISSGSLAWGDYDQDGDLDILVTGEDAQFKFYTRIYRNDLNPQVSKLSSPTQLRAEVKGRNVFLSWDKNGQTRATFNVRVGRQPQQVDVLSPMANPLNGSRHIAASGNAQHQARLTLKDLAPGTYYWSVQSISPAFQASPFAEEQRFVIE